MSETIFCTCRFTDAWVCKRDRGASHGVACSCACHRQPIQSSKIGVFVCSRAKPMTPARVAELDALIKDLHQKYPPLPKGPWLISQKLSDAISARTIESTDTGRAVWSRIGGIALVVDPRINENSMCPWYVDEHGHIFPVPLERPQS